MDEATRKKLCSSKKTEYETPKDLYAKLHKIHKFTLDPASTKNNALCKKFFTKKENGLEQSWKGERVFLNPPYGRRVQYWIKKCHEEFKAGTKVIVALLPARTCTKWFHQYIYKKPGVKCEFLKGRLFFTINGKPDVDKDGKPTCAMFPSMIVTWKR